MSNRMKLKRIVDLFSEGDVCYLGDDDEGKPVCIWINKNTSLEEEEARMDGQSARTQYLLAVANPMHPDMQHAHMVISEWTDDDLYQACNNQNYEKCVALAAADVESNEEWAEKLAYLRRQGDLLDDAKVDEDDPRRVELQKVNEEYLAEVEKHVDKRLAETFTELKEKGRALAEETFLKDYKEKMSLDYYMLESRITKLYFAIRECDAYLDEKGDYRHDRCDHSNRLLPSRADVRDLPEVVLHKINRTYDNVQVGYHNLANFPVPPNSLESSAQPNGAGE